MGIDQDVFVFCRVGDQFCRLLNILCRTPIATAGFVSAIIYMDKMSGDICPRYTEVDPITDTVNQLL
ncbi:MAG: hypothetical protein GY814_11410 [Gammaproteobacteria bacterium]|nr:hypothetical protein [Gammaproteobacteria bacterium]